MKITPQAADAFARAWDETRDGPRENGPAGKSTVRELMDENARLHSRISVKDAHFAALKMRCDTLTADNEHLSARVERLEADNIRLISQLVSANIVIIAAENEHRANHNKA